MIGAELTGAFGTASLEYVHALGAVHVIDHRSEDIGARGVTYDLILDVFGRSTWPRCKELLNERGLYRRASCKLRPLLQMFWTSLGHDRRRVIRVLAPGDRAALLAVQGLIEAGKLRSVIDRSSPLEHLNEAHHYAERGRKHRQAVILPHYRSSEDQYPSLPR